MRLDPIEFENRLFGEDGIAYSEVWVKTPSKDWHHAIEEYGTEEQLAIQHAIRTKTRLDKEVEDINEYFKTLNPDAIQFTPSNGCPYDTHWGVESEKWGISITAIDMRSFEVSHVVTTGGTYWEPPDVDYVVDSTHHTICSAMFAAYGMTLELAYNNQKEWEWEQSMLDEYKQYREDEYKMEEEWYELSKESEQQ